MIMRRTRERLSDCWRKTYDILSGLHLGFFHHRPPHYAKFISTPLSLRMERRPFFSISTRLQLYSISLRSWVIIMTILSSIFLITDRMDFFDSISMDRVNSSKIMMGESRRITRANAIFCFSPLDRLGRTRPPPFCTHRGVP